MEQLKHECGVAMIRLLKPLEYYEEKYGTSAAPPWAGAWPGGAANRPVPPAAGAGFPGRAAACHALSC